MAIISEEAEKLLHIEDGDTNFNEMLKNKPNSSELWIQCIAFYILRKNYGKAKEMAERALSNVQFRYVKYFGFPKIQGKRRHLTESAPN